MEKKSGSKPEAGQAAELLSGWRAAERDTAAAKSAATIASLALGAAHAAEDAAVETEAAAKAAAEAVERALLAAGSAKRAASAAAEAAALATTVAEGEIARTNHGVTVAEESEEKARGRFRKAEDRGFSKNGD